MAVISDLEEEDHKQNQENTSSSSSDVETLASIMAKMGPMNFLKTVFDLISTRSDLFKDESSVEKALALVSSVKEREDAERRKSKIQEHETRKKKEEERKKKEEERKKKEEEETKKNKEEDGDKTKVDKKVDEEEARRGSSLADLPLKNFYRYVVPAMDDFSAIDFSINEPKAFFSNMPLSRTLTMNLDVPEPWLVEPIIAIHDLDNILLEDLRNVSTLQAVFELEALLLTGHCSEKDHDPPRGLQLILGSKQMPHLVDTLVMANLGYWQMKVSPGVWYMQLAPGRSADLYVLKESGDESQSYPLTKRIIICQYVLDHSRYAGSNAARVWVNVVKVDDAEVWRPSDEIEYMKDAIGSSIEWPMDKLVVF